MGGASSDDEAERADELTVGSVVVESLAVLLREHALSRAKASKAITALNVRAFILVIVTSFPSERPTKSAPCASTPQKTVHLVRLTCRLRRTVSLWRAEVFGAGQRCYLNAEGVRYVRVRVRYCHQKWPSC